MSEKTTFTKGDLSITTADPAEKVRLRSQGFAPADAAPDSAEPQPNPADAVVDPEAPRRSRSTRAPEKN